MSKQPSHSGERPMPDAAPDSGEKPFDPSHFGRHQFPDGLREELIKAPKPRIDPKFLQDTVPPNQNSVLTEPERPVMTPRGGFAAPKPQGGSVDRDAPTLIAAPAAKSSPSHHDRDATTLIKVPTAKAAPRVAKSKPANSPSTPPVDTSRTDPTILIPGARRKNEKQALVIGIIAALLLLLVVAFLLRPSSEIAPTTATPTPKPAAAPDPAPVRNPTTPPAATPAAAPTSSIQTAQPASLEPSARPDASAHPSAADSPSAPKKIVAAPKPQPNAKPTPVARKTTRPGFDPSKPWEED
jgi:hypothetical protein